MARAVVAAALRLARASAVLSSAHLGPCLMALKSVLEQGMLSEAQAFSNLIEALRIAESSARQLAYMKDQKAWIKVQFSLETTRELVTKMAIG